MELRSTNLRALDEEVGKAGEFLVTAFMPKRSNAFQTLVAQIQHHFGREADYSVEESRFLQNADTGEDREVDIVVEGSIAHVPFIFSFECTSGKRKAGSPWIEGMIGKHRKLPTHRLILVSESGFTKPALAAVDAEKDVEAVTFHEANEVDWSAYAERFKKLRFNGVELKPINVQAHWLVPPGVDEKELSRESSPVFRKIDTGQELSASALALDILRNHDVGNLVAERYINDQNAVELRESAKQKVLGFEGQMDVKMQPKPGTWEICFKHATCPLSSVDVTAKVYIRDTPMSLSYKSFMGTRVAHTIVKRPFANIEKDKGDEIVFVITQVAEKEEPVVSVAFADADPESKVVYSASIKKDREPDGTT